MILDKIQVISFSRYNDISFTTSPDSQQTTESESKLGMEQYM